MRTTVDLPDDLFRRVKALAALRGLKLKDFLTGLIEEGLRTGTDTVRESPRELPNFRGLTDRPVRNLSNAEIEVILAGEDADPS